MTTSDVRTLATGIVFGESPRWGRDGRLWLADWGTRQILAVDAGGRKEVVLDLGFPSFQPISLDWLPDGRLLFVSSREGRLVRRESDGALGTHADLNGVARGGWNELVVDGRGNAYVNGAAFDGRQFAPGIIALARADGAVRQVAGDIAFPNGMAVTPDNRTLIIAESWGCKLTAFDIAADGALANRRVWADLGGDNPDGICLDAEGALWYADVPHKRCVRVREGGEVLQTIDFDLGAFACILGGPGGRSLYVVIREWRGFESTTDPSPVGRIVVAPAPAPRAGWP